MGNSKERPVLECWLETDLTAAAVEGRLERAFELDDVVLQAEEILAAGRSPIITGEQGIGKTALVHQLVRRSLTEPRSPLSGKRVLQMSIRRCASTLTKDQAMGSSMLDLVRTLRSEPDVIPYFRDFHMAWRYDLEPQFESMAFNLGRVCLCEGRSSTVQMILEYEPELENYFAVLQMREPDIERARRIATAWSRGREIEYAESAVEMSLQLSHRFLARSRLPRKCLEPLAKLETLRRSSNVQGPVTANEVTEYFCESFGIPRILVDTTVALDLDRLNEKLRQDVLGQEEAVSAMMNMISRIKAALIDPRRPFGAFLFVGPTGVGKTHLARLLAENLLGSGDKMIRLNMADYPEDNHANTVFGDPDDDRSLMRRGVLTQRIMGHPFAVLLLDEFEKASTKLHDRFLQLFDEGSFINGAGETISCRSLVIIATSNAGAELWREDTVGFRGTTTPPLDRDLDHRLHQHFRFEFLNRFDQVVHFQPLTRENIRTLAVRELKQIESRGGIRLRGIRLEVDEAVLDWLTVHGYDPFFGARFLRRTIERNVSSALATLLIKGPPAGSEAIELSVRHNAVYASWIAAAPLPSRSAVRLVEGTGDKVRNLDVDALIREASELTVAGEQRAVELEAEREEYSQLLSLMNEPAFWERSDESREILDRFRELDVSIRVQKRLTRPLVRLSEALDAVPVQPERLARHIEAAGTALREWESRHAERFGQVWIAIRAVDPMVPSDGWIGELAEMELEWCRRLQLDATVVGYALTAGELTAVGIEVSGPGSTGYLRLEHGVHRLNRKERRDLRVRVDVVPQGSDELDVEARAAGKVPGRLGLEPTTSVKLRIEKLGLAEDWFGVDETSIGHFVSDYTSVLSDRVTDAPETARIYAESGIGARDPRTQETVPRYKDVMRGRLDRLLQAWQRK